MSKATTAAALLILTVGIPLIWRAWPRPLPPEPNYYEFEFDSGTIVTIQCIPNTKCYVVYVDDVVLRSDCDVSLCQP